MQPCGHVRNVHGRCTAARFGKSCDKDGRTQIVTMTTGTRTYKIDKAHSEAIFQVRHLVTKVRGRFKDFEGTIQYDEMNPEQSSVDFTIRASSIDTAEADRDTHLRTADFFDVDTYPTITFRSKRITRRSGEDYDLVGELTMHGVTKEIVLTVAHMGKAIDPWGGQRIGFEAEATLNRKDFGLNWNAILEAGGFLVGDDVKVSIEVQAIAQ
jgi:polyisoprenoid-binding protein YceI